jgi:hypothetical protein
MKVAQLHALFRQIVERRRRDLSTKRTDIRVTEVVGDDQQNIRPLGGCGFANLMTVHEHNRHGCYPDEKKGISYHDVRIVTANGLSCAALFGRIVNMIESAQSRAQAPRSERIAETHA